MEVLQNCTTWKFLKMYYVTLLRTEKEKLGVSPKDGSRRVCVMLQER